MTTFSELWSGLRQEGGSAPFLLIDCAGIEGGAARLPHEALSDLECLFTGDLADELADVGPYLGRLKSLAPEVRVVAEEALANQVALLAIVEDPEDGQPPLSFAQLHRHLRKFNVVYDPEGKPLYFRYCDPRILVDVLKLLDSKQLDGFFGPISRLVLVDGRGQVLQLFRQGGKCVVLG